MEKGHYTLTEIGRQHDAFAITRNQFPAFAQIIEEVRKEGFTKILFLGCGTSYFLAAAASAYFARFNDITCDYLASFEFYKNTECYVKPSDKVLLVPFTRVASTTETMIAVKKGVEMPNVKSLQITCDDFSKTYSTWSLFIPDMHENSIVMTSSFSTMLYTTMFFAAQMAGTMTVAGGWMGLAAFGLQIYFDFSGYSDMAIGLGQVFGFHFDENFDHPYMSTSVSEFWRRWHMSLTNWFREYLYIPLGGNRGGTFKTLRNIFIVWFCTGFWHGASWNFILWGLYFAAWLILEKYVLKSVLAKTPVVIKHIYTLIVVFVGWGIFAMEDLSVCGRYLAACFGNAPLWNAVDGYTIRSYAITFLALIVASTALGKRVWNRLPERVQKIAAPVLIMLSLLIGTAYLVDGSYNPFLYFRF